MEQTTIYYSSRRELLPYIPKNKKNVLDVGCSSGNFSALLKMERACLVHGIEYDPKSAAEAATKIDLVLVGDALEKIKELQNGFYDLVTMNDVLEHMLQPGLFLQAIHEKLSPEGVIFAVVPNIRYYKALNHILYDKDFKYEDAGIFDKTHLRFFTKKSIIRLFLNSGFEPINYFGINKTSSLSPWIRNLLTLGAYGEDTRYLQYCFIGKSRK